MALSTGQQAPNFSLYNSEKKLVSLEDLRGQNVLLLFFPLAFSSVCTAELCSVSEDISKYSNLKAEVIGISVDSLYVLNEFQKTQHINFKLLSDFNKNVSMEYDCLHETFSYGMKGVSKRAAFVIDKNGKIVYIEVLDNPGLQPNFSAIKEVLNGLD